MGGSDAGKYAAFISYAHADREWGVWLHRSLEAYRIPRGVDVSGTGISLRARRLGRVFRDDDELRSGDLGPQIEAALAASDALIVICSPRAAKSRWVAEEIRRFKRRAGARVLALIVEGEPHAADPALECFPAPLSRGIDSSGNLTDQTSEVLAPDVRVFGKDGVLLRLVAGLVGLDFDDLFRREAQRRKRERRRALALSAIGTTLLIVGIVGVAASWLMSRNVVLARSRLIAAVSSSELAKGHVDNAMLLALLAAPVPGAASTTTAEAQAALDAVGPYAGKTLAVLRGTEDAVIDARFSTDGRRAFSVDERGKLLVYSTIDHSIALRLDGVATATRKAIYDVSPSGGTLAVARADGGAELWSLTHYQRLGETAGLPGKLVGMRFVDERADGSGSLFVAAADGALGTVRFAAGSVTYAELAKLPHRVQEIWISGDLAHAAVLLDSDYRLSLYSIATGQRVHRFDGYAAAVSALSFDPARHRVVSAALDKTVRVFDLESGRMLGMAEADGPVLAAALSPDGKELIATVPAGSVMIWRLADAPAATAAGLLDVTVTSPAHQGWLPAVRYSPDGSWIATVGRDRRLGLWSRAFKPIAMLPGHGGEARVVDIAPDGRTLMTGDGAGVVRFWKAPDSDAASVGAPYSVADICAGLPRHREHLVPAPGGSPPAWAAAFYLPAELANSNVIAADELFPCERDGASFFGRLSDIVAGIAPSLKRESAIANRLDCDRPGVDRNACLIPFDERRAAARRQAVRPPAANRAMPASQ